MEADIKKRIVLNLSLCILCLAVLIYGTIRMITNGVEIYLVLNGITMIILLHRMKTAGDHRSRD